MVQLVEGVDRAFQGGTSGVDGSIELTHRVMDEVGASQHVVLHVVHLFGK